MRSRGKGNTRDHRVSQEKKEHPVLNHAAREGVAISLEEKEEEEGVGYA